MQFFKGGCQRKRSDVVNPGQDEDETAKQHQPISCKVDFYAHGGIFRTAAALVVFLDSFFHHSTFCPETHKYV